MNIEGFAYTIMALAIVTALCAIMMVMDLELTRAEGKIDISEPTEETEPEETVPEVTEEPTTPEPTEVIIAPEETIPEVPEPIVETEPIGYYDVPLSTNIQDHIFALCGYYDIEPEIIIAMIRKESNFEIGAMGDGGNSYGLMQIQPRWHQERMDRLGVTDLTDPYQNITVGVDYLAECIEMGGGSLEWGLMAYNGGPSYAREMRANGEISYYAQIVLQWAEEYAGY